MIDGDGNAVGTTTRAEMRARRLRHRCTAVLVRDGSDRVLVHRRSEEKDLWPGRWDLACGGVVGAGEDWDLAAVRELAEELGIEGVPLGFIGERSFTDGEVDEIARLYTVRWDGPIRFTDGEVVEVRWVTPDELRTLLAAEPFVTDSVALLLDVVLRVGSPDPPVG